MKAIKKRLVTLPNPREAFELLKSFEYLYNTQNLISPALNVSGAAATVSLGATIVAIINGQLVQKASGQTITLNGPTVPNSVTPWQVYLFTMDAAGSLYCYAGQPGASLAAVQLPVIDEVSFTPGAGGGVMGPQQCVIGGLIINNASAGAFVPNTTLLNVAGLNPIAINTVGPFFPATLQM